MTDERAIIEALSRGSFGPGTFAKRFVRTLAAGPEDRLLSFKQRQVLWGLVHRYRRQFPQRWELLAGVLRRRAAWPEQQRVFEDMLDNDPADAGTRLVYSDWLEENGQSELATAHRWLATNGFVPTLEPGGQSYGAAWAQPINFEWTFGMEVWEFFGIIASDPAHLVYWHCSQQVAMERLAKALAASGGNPKRRER